LYNIVKSNNFELEKGAGTPYRRVPLQKSTDSNDT